MKNCCLLASHHKNTVEQTTKDKCKRGRFARGNHGCGFRDLERRSKDRNVRRANQMSAGVTELRTLRQRNSIVTESCAVQRDLRDNVGTNNQKVELLQRVIGDALRNPSEIILTGECTETLRPSKGGEIGNERAQLSREAN